MILVFCVVCRPLVQFIHNKRVPPTRQVVLLTLRRQLQKRDLKLVPFHQQIVAVISRHCGALTFNERHPQILVTRR